jgi:DNA polymerase-3 subunit epsilon/oligoribonuclease
MLGIFLDSETSGLNAQRHAIVEIAYKVVDVRTGALKGEYQTVVAQPHAVWQYADPESLRVNGFTWEEVAAGKRPETVASEIRASFDLLGIRRGAAVFICQNPSFDRVFFSQLIDADVQEKLLWPYHWLDLASMYWAQAMRRGLLDAAFFPWETGVSKDKIAKTYHLPSEGKPHRAMNGVEHLLLCYQAVIGFPLSS